MDVAGGLGVPQLFGMLIDGMHILLWPLVFALRVVLRRPWFRIKWGRLGTAR